MNVKIFTRNKFFHMLALDHRGSLTKALGSSNEEELVSFKRSIIDATYDDMSGVLLDPVHGLKAYEGRRKPYLLCIEKSGYKDVNGDRLTELEYTVSELKQQGASGVKLLIQYDHDSATANTQMEIAEKVAKDCKIHDLPFFLEIITYNVVGSKANQILNAITMMLDQGIRPDVFKLEYPDSSEYCQAITHVLGDIPWILLTKAAPYEEFKKHLGIAVQRGASGFLAGRSIWQEAVGLHRTERDTFIANTVSARFEELVSIAA